MTMLPVATPRETRAWLAAEVRSRKLDVALTTFVGLLAAAAGVIPVYAVSYTHLTLPTNREV